MANWQSTVVSLARAIAACARMGTQCCLIPDSPKEMSGCAGTLCVIISFAF